jgi:hypothetical protein
MHMNTSKVLVCQTEEAMVFIHANVATQVQVLGMPPDAAQQSSPFVNPLLVVGLTFPRSVLDQQF